jgi:hypothetical protein
VIAATVTPPRFPDHVAARVAAAWEDSRPAIPKLPIPGPRGPVDHDGDSDPDADELLKRARSPRSNFGSCLVCGQPITSSGGHQCPGPAPLAPAARQLAEIEAAWDAPTREGLDAYNEWAAGAAA